MRASKLTMDDTDNDLSEDLLSDLSEPDRLVRLPCDQPWWSEAALVLEELAQSRTSLDIQEKITKLGHITGSESRDNKTLSHFLEAVCGEEERQLLCDLVIPGLATVALQINKLKPFIGLQAFTPGDCHSRLLHPDFVISLVSHSFLSTTGRETLNLNLNSLDPESSETHWKLRCYFSYFHTAFQDSGGRGNLIVLKQTSHVQTFDSDGLKDQKLINFVPSDDSQDESPNCLRLTFLEDFSKGLVTTSNPMNSEFSLKRPQLLLSFLLADDLELNESIRASGSSCDCGSLTVVKAPEMDRTETSLTLALESLLLGMKTDWSTGTKKSLLRRPSVSAVTSCSGSPPQVSVSESSLDNLTDSELSHDISARLKGGEVRRNKTKKKESFNERLKAALERGNTPDESDDQSAPKLSLKPVVPLHKRLIRRQRSSGFKTFNDLDDSEEFFTATEDERSHTPARRLGPLRLAPGKRIVSSPLCSPVMDKRPVAALSASPSHGSSPSPSTCSSNLASDSDSFSSEGLGMPKMEDDCLEDLCDKLHGCLETAEGGLQFRNIELRRAVRALGVTSLSQSFLTTVSDLDHLGGRHVSPPDSQLDSVVLSPSYSCPDVFGLSCSVTGSTGGGLQEFCTVMSHSRRQGELWEQQVWPLLLWLAGSCSPPHQTVKFNMMGNTNLQQLPALCKLIAEKNMSPAALYDIIVEFLSSDEDNFFTFLNNKLVAF